MPPVIQKKPDCLVAVISCGRPGNVPRVEDMVPGCEWFVPENEAYNYDLQSAGQIHPIGGIPPMKSVQLNQALYTAAIQGKRYCATLDDDLTRARRYDTREHVSWTDLIASLCRSLDANPGLYLAGCKFGVPPNWASGRVDLRGNVNGSLMVHRVGLNEDYSPSHLEFDEELLNLVDLDLCLAHHDKYGGLVRDGTVCVENNWSSAGGGLQQFRSEEMVRASCERVQSKWAHLGVTIQYDESVRNRVRVRVPWRKLTKGVA